MLYIKKRKQPLGLSERIIEIKKSAEWKNVDDDNSELLRVFFDMLDKQLIRENLITEQHGVCAYCMKRIEASAKSMTIEHFLPVNGHKDNVLDYNNMLGVCKGGSEVALKNHGVLCCDSSKKDTAVKVDPRDEHLMEMIRYRKDGRIYVCPADAELQHDIDNVLCLNGKLDENGNILRDTATQLVMGRRNAYKQYVTYIKMLQKKHNGNESKMRTEIKKKISQLEELEIYPEFVGVTLYFLRRKVREKSAS